MEPIEATESVEVRMDHMDWVSVLACMDAARDTLIEGGLQRRHVEEVIKKIEEALF